tara:strand:- start:244 stop:594 length:351 start_codon:yes stop_codon:yes gene_type:complete
MSSQKQKSVVFTFEEEVWLRYIHKIESDRTILDNLLFSGKDGDLTPYNKSKLCEYYSVLYSLEEIMYKLADDDFFDPETKSFIVSEDLAMKFSLFMQALVLSKEIVTENNCSISLH